MYRVGKLFITILILAFLTGCSTTDLSYKNNQLILKVDGKQLQMDSRFINHRMKNFSTLFIDQQLLQLNEGNMVVYEKCRTDDMNEFYFPTRDTIQVVFDARYVDIVYFSSSFYIMQVGLAEGRPLNVIVEQLEDQSMNMVYGMTNKQINHLLSQLDSQKRMPVDQHVITLNRQQSAILSRWTTYKVNVMQLVGPRRDMFGF